MKNSKGPGEVSRREMFPPWGQASRVPVSLSVPRPPRLVHTPCPRQHQNSSGLGAGGSWLRCQPGMAFQPLRSLPCPVQQAWSGWPDARLQGALQPQTTHIPWSPSAPGHLLTQTDNTPQTSEGWRFLTDGSGKKRNHF